jgi:hypothetical protein
MRSTFVVFLTGWPSPSSSISKIALNPLRSPWGAVVALDHQALLLDNVLRRMQNHQAKEAALLRPLSLAERFCQEQAGEYPEGMSQSNRALG